MQTFTRTFLLVSLDIKLDRPTTIPMPFSQTPVFLLLVFSSLLWVGSCALATPQRFNVDNYGAKGDSKTDSTEAFGKAWVAMCESKGEAEMYVPEGEYFVQPVTFLGQCACPKPAVRIEGSVVGPTDYMVISKAERWIQFKRVDNLVIQGGRLVGRGKYLVDCTVTGQDPKCPFGGKMLSISNSNHVTINNLTSLHSQGFHIVIEGSNDINIVGSTIVAPENSPNTDGIHVQGSTSVTISYSSIQTGDDCISLGQGAQNIWIQNIQCGPGHGISIGSLANVAGELAVRNVTATNVTFNGSSNGFRIKSWAKPFSATVSNIHFLNSSMVNVSNPIIIDQYYCPQGGCPLNQPSFAKISGVEYSNINGTSRTEVAIAFKCSSKFPCTGLTLRNVKLTHSPNPAVSIVKNAVLKTTGVVEPGVGQ